MGRYRREIALAVLLAAGTVAVFAPALAYGFVNYDDPKYVADNGNVTAGLTAANASWALTTAYEANWHPLTWWSLQLDAEIAGRMPGLDRAAVFHLTNVLLHAANVVLLFLVLRRLTGAVWPSALVAALFGVHPLHVESVAWVTERKDVLSTLFGLLAIGAYARYAERPGVGRYVVVVLALGLGLMAKPMLVTWPLVFLLLDYWPLGRVAEAGLRDRRDKPGGSPLQATSPFQGGSLRWLVAEKVPLVALAAASCVATVWAQRRGGAVQPLELFPLSERVANAVVAYVVYLRKVVWPNDLAVFYPREPLGRTAVAASAAFLAAVTAWAVAQARRRPYVLVGWLWYLGTLVPVIGLVQVGEQALADRYSYVPLIGIFIIAAWGLADLAAWRAWPAALPGVVAGAALAACAVLTRAQLAYWHDSKALWRHALAVTTGNYEAHNHVARLLEAEGHRLEAEGKLPEARRKATEALAHYQAAMRANDRLSAAAAVNEGEMLLRQGDADGAERAFRRALQMNGAYPPALTGLGAAFDLRRDRAHAVVAYNQALALWDAALAREPEDAVARLNRGHVLTALGRLPEATEDLRAAVRLDPADADAHTDLGAVLCKQGRLAEGIQEFEAALRLKPDHAIARRNLAQARADAGGGGRR